MGECSFDKQMYFYVYNFLEMSCCFLSHFLISQVVQKGCVALTVGRDNFGQFFSFCQKLPFIHVGVLDSFVMQMRKVNREKGYLNSLSYTAGKHSLLAFTVSLFVYLFILPFSF